MVWAVLLQRFQCFKEIKSSDDLTCEICFETIPSSKQFKSIRCSHRFCCECISRYIETKVTDDNAVLIKCPQVGCKEIFKPLKCRSILPPKTFIRWCDNMCKLLVDRRWPDKVHCPYNNCSELVVDECKESNVKRQTRCPICKRLFCYRCRVPWHTGYFCDRNGVRRGKDDVLFDRLALNRGWKRCPKCDMCVELVSGCSYMQCRCGTAFCYNCGRKRSYHFFHRCLASARV